MAKISQDELFDGDIIKFIKVLIKNLNELDEGFKDIVKTQNELAQETVKDAKGMRKFTESVSKTKEAVEGLSQIQKDRIKLQDKLKRANSDEIQQNVQLQVQLQEQNKINKEIERNKLGLISAFDKESKRLKVLRNRWKDLAVQNKENTKEGKILLKEFTKLDKKLKDIKESAGQTGGAFSGAVSKGTGKAKVAFASLSGFLLGVFAKTLTRSRDEARKFSITIEKVGNTVGVIFTAIIAFVKDKAIPAISIFINQIENGFTRISIKALEFQKSIQEALSFLGGANAAGKVNILNKEIEALEKTIDKNDRSINDYRETLDNAKDSFTGIIDRIKLSNSTLEQQLIVEDALINTTARLSLEINNLTTSEELLQSIADDNTKSFADREDAIRAVIDVQQERIGLEIQIANQSIEAAELAIKNDFIRRNELAKFNELQATGSIRNLEFLKNRETADLVGIDNLQKLTEATNALASAEGDLEVSAVQSQKTIDELKQDRLEKDLDILIDGFDNQKTINERIIANDKVTLEERRKVLDDTVKLSDDSFKRQIETIQEFTDIQVDANDLISESDAVVLNQKIRDLGLSEIIEGRLLEIIRDRKTANQDLKESTEDLSEAEREAALLREDIADQEEAIADGSSKALEKLNKELIKNQIENLRLRLELAKKGSKEALEIQKELNELILQEQEEANNKLVEDAQKTQDAIFSIISNGLKKRSDRIIKAIDAEIEAAKNRRADLRALAREGIQDASEALAFEQKKQAELARAREKEIQRQQRRELTLTAIQTYGAKVQAGEKNALGKTIADITLLSAFIENLPLFFDGADDIGTTSNPLDSNGGRLVVAHDNEQIWSKSDRGDVGNKSREEIKGIVNDWESTNMAFTNSDALAGPRINVVQTENGYLVKEMREISKAIKDKPTLTDIRYSELERAMIQTIHKGNKTERLHQKTGGIHGTNI